MVSAALLQWQSSRKAKLDNLLKAHLAVGGSKAGRRWATEELNHAIILRLASEFQGYCRDLHDEAIQFVVHSTASADPEVRRVLTFSFLAARRLDRGNAEPGALGNDFSLFNVDLWPNLHAHYPTKSSEWRRRLEMLNKARNGIAHDDKKKIADVVAADWPLTLPSVKRWRSGLDGLARGMDHVVNESLRQLLNKAPW
ncbi:hypothetical protein Q5530_04395 [Saccharothrix sp. BKS2]|uniref:RiboL-PSP-HEPN domain-containing protein n=1 Tax=Saccharothrix lopnurensis TaxID=1670621 RepID=A0ABW1NYN3_9PSEU